MLRCVTSLIATASDERSLLEQVCKAVVDAAGYRCAWIGYVDEGHATLRPAVAWGSGRLADGQLSVMTEGGEQPPGTLSAQGTQVPAEAAVRLPALDARAACTSLQGADGELLAVIPLCAGSNPLGVLLVQEAGIPTLDDAELALLREAGRVLAYGIAALRSAAERARAEAELARIDRARRTLSAGNRALVRATAEQVLLDEVCRISVEEGGYRDAWVAYLRHDEDKSVEVMAQFGVDRAYLEGLRCSWGPSTSGRGAVGIAIRTGRPSIGRNIAEDPDLAPWRDEALRRGIAAVSAFPLRVDGAVIGTLGLHASDPDAFNQAEEELLSELADDLAFGIETLRTRARSREAEAAIKRLAEQDALTGLPNRWRLRKRLDDEIASSKRTHRSLALLMVGIDQFQEVNETLGYEQGDVVLSEIAARLARIAGDCANIARMGEAEFAILLPDGDAASAARTGQRILTALLEPVEAGDVLLDASGSIGIAVFPGHGSEPDALIRRANVAMQQARQQGQRMALYTGGQDKECARRLALIGDLHRAIERNELRLYCQPKVRIAGGETCGAEALVRWEHPRLGLIQPSEFIALAERTGLISPLTDWVMRAAFRQGYMWRDAGVRVPLAVNVSARDLRDPRLVERVSYLMATWGGEPDAVQFELTESALMHDPHGCLESMRRLKDLGIKLFIDDFGTGYSSLAYLQKFPVDAIKIDQSFVRDMLSDTDSAVIVRSTIDLAHDLDLEVVAEGVEDRQRWDHLAEEGCDIAQGYFVSQPLPADTYLAWRADATIVKGPLQ
ncbi:GGDEF domain-containing protein [Azoarcus sp. KH32C]|uniref:GGDEF domain-containing protein n=1 Tax=Azoarcus sp. KH32C TaxID=748247 RepID=UPI0002386B6A|nr:GGDEF domain-containing protein [Azoarcus sp. KH32C]BAL24864.1 putative signaling protein [Azoarcus sp. KH32C]